MLELPQYIQDQIFSYLSSLFLHSVVRRINKQWKDKSTQELKTRMAILYSLLPLSNSDEQKEKQKIADCVVGRSMALEIHKYHLTNCIYTWTYTFHKFDNLSEEQKSVLSEEDWEEYEWTFTHNFLVTISLPQQTPQNYTKLTINKTHAWDNILPIFTLNGCNPQIFCKDDGVLPQYLEMLMLASKETFYSHFHKQGSGNSNFIEFINDATCLSFSLLPSSYAWISPSIPRMSRTVCVLLQDRSKL